MSVSSLPRSITMMRTQRSLTLVWLCDDCGSPRNFHMPCVTKFVATVSLVPRILTSMQQSFSVQIAKNRQSKASMKASLKHRQELGEMNPHSDVKLEEFWSLRDYPSDWEEVTGSETCSTSNLSVHINVGTVNTSLHLKDIPNKTTESSKRPASTGRIVSFPNWLQVSAPLKNIHHALTVRLVFS